MALNYRLATEQDQQSLLNMMLLLYKEDASRGLGTPMNRHKALNTITTLRQHPDKGCILILECDQQIVGYSIIINFWSNEYGGNIIDIDEFFVQKNNRSQGIGSWFIERLMATRFNNCVAMQLEVSPANTKARELYQRLGFQTHKNEVMIAEFQ